MKYMKNVIIWYVLLVVVNCFAQSDYRVKASVNDSKIIPEAQALINYNNNEISYDSTNAYYKFVGLGCKKDIDPSKAGFLLISDYNRKVKSIEKNMTDLAVPTGSSISTIADSLFDSLGVYEVMDVISFDNQKIGSNYFMIKIPIIDSLNQKYRLYLDRYDNFFDFKNFENTRYPHLGYSNENMPVYHLKYLKLASILANEEFDSKFDDLKREYENSLKLISQSSSQKELFLMLSEVDLIAYNYYIDSQPITDKDLKNVKELLEGFDKVNLNFDDYFEYNFLTSFAGLKLDLEFNLPYENPDIGKMINMSLNRNINKKFIVNYYYCKKEILKEISSLSSNEYYESKLRYLQVSKLELSKIQDIYEQFLNPTLGFQVMDYHLSLIIFTRLLRLKCNIYLNNIETEDIQEFLNKQNSDLINPITKEPFKWDKKKHIVYCFSKDELIKYSSSIINNCSYLTWINIDK